MTLLEEAKAEVIVACGGPVRSWLKEALSIEPVTTAATANNYRMQDVMIGEEEVHVTTILREPYIDSITQCTVVFLPRPEYIQRWADLAVEDKVTGFLETLFVEHVVEVDETALQRKLREDPEPKTGKPSVQDSRRLRQAFVRWQPSTACYLPRDTRSCARRKEASYHGPGTTNRVVLGACLSAPPNPDN